MSWLRPSSTSVWEAIGVYVAHAYDKPPPAAVRDRLEQLKQTDPEHVFDAAVFERDKEDPQARYSLRLGNRFYPHMKLVIERAPNGEGHLFRADTHTRHVRPAPESKDYATFSQIIEQNQKLAEEIEAEWGRKGLPTFREFLRQDLARRGATPPAAPGAPASRP